jgi:hypothetical protein
MVLRGLQRLFNYIDDNASINPLPAPFVQNHEVNTMEKGPSFVDFSVLTTTGRTFWPVWQKNLAAEEKVAHLVMFYCLDVIWISEDNFWCENEISCKKVINEEMCKYLVIYEEAVIHN